VTEGCVTQLPALFTKTVVIQMNSSCRFKRDKEN